MNQYMEKKEYQSSFFAMMSRMKYINRWALMRNSYPENISEHSLEVGMIAHVLALISNKRLGNSYNAERAAIIGMYHDCTEIITGDMPTPVKYYSPVIRNAYAEVENVAKDEMLSGLPEMMRKHYNSVLLETEEEERLWIYVKAADKMSALIKCIEEQQMGNQDFADAAVTIEKALVDMKLKEVDYFMKEFLPAYKLTLDKSGKEV